MPGSTSGQRRGDWQQERQRCGGQRGSDGAHPTGQGGSGGGTRTHNLRINSPPLCRLSYPGTERSGAYQGALVQPDTGGSRSRAGPCGSNTSESRIDQTSSWRRWAPSNPLRRMRGTRVRRRSTTHRRPPGSVSTGNANATTAIAPAQWILRCVHHIILHLIPPGRWIRPDGETAVGRSGREPR